MEETLSVRSKREEKRGYDKWFVLVSVKLANINELLLFYLPSSFRSARPWPSFLLFLQREIIIGLTQFN